MGQGSSKQVPNASASRPVPNASTRTLRTISPDTAVVLIGSILGKGVKVDPNITKNRNTVQKAINIMIAAMEKRGKMPSNKNVITEVNNVLAAMKYVENQKAVKTNNKNVLREFGRAYHGNNQQLIKNINSLTPNQVSKIIPSVRQKPQNLREIIQNLKAPVTGVPAQVIGVPRNVTGSAYVNMLKKYGFSNAYENYKKTTQQPTIRNFISKMNSTVNSKQPNLNKALAILRSKMTYKKYGLASTNNWNELERLRKELVSAGGKKNNLATKTLQQLRNFKKKPTNSLVNTLKQNASRPNVTMKQLMNIKKRGQQYNNVRRLVNLRMTEISNELQREINEFIKKYFPGDKPGNVFSYILEKEKETTSPVRGVGYGYNKNRLIAKVKKFQGL